MYTKLLSRDEFRENVFKRDKYRCIICGNLAKDAHHIMERRLFPDGGYYLDNGASLCAEDHIKAEQTTISCQEIRNAANISSIILPPHLYIDQEYDKWGNPILANGSRMIGELFFDESVQKALKPILSVFTKYIKYPRTWHLPWSDNKSVDDRILTSDDIFKDKNVVVTVKMDGENTTFYNNYMHARSIDSKHNKTRNWVKNFHANISWQIPEGWRVCGENLWAKHQIYYDNLTSYFMMFSIWNEKNICLSWDETLEWSQLLNMVMVPVLYIGMYDKQKIKDKYEMISKNINIEGYVIRLSDNFSYMNFHKSVGKYVKGGFTAGSHKWGKEPIIKNKLIEFNELD